MKTQKVHAGESHHTRLVGFSDLQGRDALQVTLRGDWCYVAHLPGNRLNSLTGQSEDNGTTILNVSQPKHPIIVAHIPGASGANCRAVQVVESYHDGNDYLIRIMKQKQLGIFRSLRSLTGPIQYTCLVLPEHPPGP